MCYLSRLEQKKMKKESERERERPTGLPWKSILHNSLLPSRQIKGPLLKKWGRVVALGEFARIGATKGSFYHGPEQPLIAPELKTMLLYH